jgi:hypothetical protein
MAQGRSHRPAHRRAPVQSTAGGARGARGHTDARRSGTDRARGAQGGSGRGTISGRANGSPRQRAHASGLIPTEGRSTAARPMVVVGRRFAHSSRYWPGAIATVVVDFSHVMRSVRAMTENAVRSERRRRRPYGGVRALCSSGAGRRNGALPR